MNVATNMMIFRWRLFGLLLATLVLAGCATGKCSGTYATGQSAPNVPVPDGLSAPDHSGAIIVPAGSRQQQAGGEDAPCLEKPPRLVVNAPPKPAPDQGPPPAREPDAGSDPARGAAASSLPPAPPTGPAENTVAAAAPAVPLTTATAPAAGSPTGPAAGQSKQDNPVFADSLPGSIEAMVRDWEAAWQRGDIDAFLDYYAADFKPPTDLSRDAWDKRHRELIAGPTPVAMRIDKLGMLTPSADGQAASVRIVQRFDISGRIEALLKELELIRGPDGWKIVGERVIDLL